ncbi:monooxygenase, putative [Talaromyces stipitatus ATCC 10500]|uniref:Monooxygenase, putative n=1 Tax=Talaromyces stipitatus (strain ATCC 10500 / CBS 375.48 / QM 6759 / NRRL 1006) TaxID=441959 RepID=B8ME44_TALSN|nr:monooxygenase, putative [Talaromyces stipitatus ATCC 10500]EED16121.1 monooxygenase, putative [Talaromyces stipitatus ATCC 10500]
MGSIDLQPTRVAPSNPQAYVVPEVPLGTKRPMRVVCIGAGATGLNLAYQIPRHLSNIDFQIYEKNEAIGGTWLENRYPGVACDIPSHLYQFLWALNPNWSEFYSSGREILQYLKDVAKKFDLERFVKLDHKVTEAQWDEDTGTWKLKIQNMVTGEEIRDSCHFLVNGSGFLNHWEWPEIPGLKDFKGPVLHSASWDPNVDCKGKRVAVIGNGSSGIQLVTALQPEAEQLTTFIRAPTWISTSYAQEWAGPNGVNFKYSDEQIAKFEGDAAEFLAYRKAMENDMNSHFVLAIADSPQQAIAKTYLAELMRQRLGPDFALTEKLIPEFGFGCRRPTPGSGYLEALSQKNVRVVMDPIDKIVEDGIRTKSGELIPLDIVVCATGFNVSWLPRFPIIGRGGIDMRDQWSKRPLSYLSFGVANFPNYALFMGPNSPLSHGSAMPSIEHIAKYVIRLIHKMQTQNYKAVEPTEQAVNEFINHADLFLQRTVWATKCRSWLKGGKEVGVPLVHPGSRLHWFHMLLEPRWEDWKWTSLHCNRFSYLGNGFSTMEEEGKDKSWYLNDPDIGYEAVVN